MFVEIHVLRNLAPSNPNRDDVGAPKSAVFGGTPRGRISSQCLKRSIRRYSEFQSALAGHLGTRTKFFPELVGERLKSNRIPEAERGRVVQACTRIAKAEESSVKTAAEDDPDEKRPRTPQLIYLDPAHVEEFVTRLERLRAEMPKAYEFYLNPVAGFQEVMAAALADVELDDATKAAVTKNAWVIAKLRLPQLRQFEGEETPNEPPEEAGDPGPATAGWIARRLGELMGRDEPANKGLFKSIQRAADRREREQLREAEPDKPRDYSKFQDHLFEPLRSRAVDIALFGRMTTSDAFEDVEACLEVAHAISTNETVREVDYFTAVDDLGTGVAAAHVGENQFTSNCYYKYFSLDWDAFVARLAGHSPTPEERGAAEELARRALKELIRAAVCAIPSGKKKGHANNNPPDAVLVEVKEKRIPTNYANAFLRPVVPADGDGDLMKGSIRKLGHYAGTVCGMYGLKPSRFWLHREGEPLVIVRTGGGKEPQKPETLADSQPDLDAMLDAVVKAIPSKGGA